MPDQPTTVAALAVYPRKPDSLHQTETTLPDLGPDHVLVDTIRVGICGTDREIIRGDLGDAPPGQDELVIGHEVLGRVISVGSAVNDLQPGDLVTSTVRRPDDCPACQAGEPDMCLWLGYEERGINKLPGFMSEKFVEHRKWLIPVPQELEPIAVLIEPLTVVEKAVRQAELIQQRLKYWKLQSAIVIGAGPIGLLGTLLLRSKGVEVYTVARSQAPNPAAKFVEACGGHYRSVKEHSLEDIAHEAGNVDLILESSGNAEVALEAMQFLGNNGVQVLLSLTGGEHEVKVPADRINTSIVIGNKVVVGSVNAGAIDFENAVKSLDTFEQQWPGLTKSLITARLKFGDDLDLSRISKKSSSEIKTVIEFD